MPEKWERAKKWEWEFTRPNLFFVLSGLDVANNWPVVCCYFFIFSIKPRTMADVNPTTKIIDSWVERFWIITWTQVGISKSSFYNLILNVNWRSRLFWRIKHKNEGVERIGSGRKPALSKTGEKIAVTRISSFIAFYNRVTSLCSLFTVDATFLSLCPRCTI